ncbi:MAG: TetR family transcriptional regulator [Acidobacteria bacterium]|nr:TetR family transcriptional regulator [Acidobacteriota bacterium]
MATRTASPNEAGMSRPGLTRSQIVEVALSLVDAEGLDRLTLRRLAEHLEVTPMALYWHFRDKDALLNALGEHLFSSVSYPAPVDDRLDDLARVLEAVLQVLRRHVAIAPLALGAVLSTDSGLVLAERVLNLLVEAGLDDRTAANVGGILLHDAVALVTSIPNFQAKMNADAPPAVDATRFVVTARLSAHLFECDDIDRWLEDGLRLMMHGVRGLLPENAELGH